MPELYELCEKESVYYIIRLKSNAKLKALAEELHPTHEIRDVSVTESYVEESIYQAASWSKLNRKIPFLLRLMRQNQTNRKDSYDDYLIAK